MARPRLRGRALVVDDSPAGRQLLQRVVASTGLKVRTAAEGSSALRLHQASPFDLLVTDWIMPGLDGVALARALRESGDATPVLVVSGYRDDDVRASCAGLGNVAWMEKPIDLERTRAVLAALLARQRQASSP